MNVAEEYAVKCLTLTREYSYHDIDFVAINFELLNTSVLYVYKLIFNKRHICRTSIYEIQFHNAFYVTITKTRCREQKY